MGTNGKTTVERAREKGTSLLGKVYDRVLQKPVGRMYHFGLVKRTGNFATTTWLGVPIWQNVLDVWTIQETLAEVKPALLIETGTHKGGSALMYAHLMDLIGTGKVLTIDIIDIREQEHPRIEFLHGSSTDPAVVERVQREVDAADGPVMVILDGNHDRDHVAAELELYAPMVSVGSYLLSQDGVIDVLGVFRDSRPGPLPANRAFLDRHREFEYDAERNERYSLTHHPLGWMKRIS